MALYYNDDNDYDDDDDENYDDENESYYNDEEDEYFDDELDDDEDLEYYSDEENDEQRRIAYGYRDKAHWEEFPNSQPMITIEHPNDFTVYSNTQKDGTPHFVGFPFPDIQAVERLRWNEEAVAIDEYKNNKDIGDCRNDFGLLKDSFAREQREQALPDTTWEEILNDKPGV